MRPGDHAVVPGRLVRDICLALSRLHARAPRWGVGDRGDCYRRPSGRRTIRDGMADLRIALQRFRTLVRVSRSWIARWRGVVRPALGRRCYLPHQSQ